jgi:hypothetical protein
LANYNIVPDLEHFNKVIDDLTCHEIRIADIEDGKSNTPYLLTEAQETIAAGTGDAGIGDAGIGDAGTSGEISIAKYYTDIAVDDGGDVFTLANGTVVGQIKKIMLSETAGGTGVITGNFRSTYNTLTFTNAGEFAVLVWDGTEWLDVELASVAILTHKPVLSVV